MNAEKLYEAIVRIAANDSPRSEAVAKLREAFGEEPEPQTSAIIKRLSDQLEWAWGVIANAGGGDWEKETPEWQVAAAGWRDRWFRTPEPPLKAEAPTKNWEREYHKVASRLEEMLRRNEAVRNIWGAICAEYHDHEPPTSPPSFYPPPAPIEPQSPKGFVQKCPNCNHDRHDQHCGGYCPCGVRSEPPKPEKAEPPYKATWEQAVMLAESIRGDLFIAKTARNNALFDLEGSKKREAILQADLQAARDEAERLKRDVRPLFHEIMGSHKASIGSIQNIYTPQLSVDQVDALYGSLFPKEEK